MLNRPSKASGDTGPALSTETDVTVDVINVDEAGTVQLQWLQPEVGQPIDGYLD